MKCIRIIIVLMAILFGQGVAFAQEGGQTETTHAHASSFKWKGLDVDTVIGNSKYNPLTGENYNPPMNKYPLIKERKSFCIM